MFKRYRAALFLTASACSLTVSLAHAGEQTAQPVAGLEEITVTARRVEENLQRVPITVTVINAADLEAKGNANYVNTLNKITGLESPAPLVGYAYGTANLRLRGVPGVVSYFADIPMTLSNPASFFDVGNFQVLKGPQGTLFGLASNAGATVANPRRPGETFGGYINASLGTYGRKSIGGAVDIPIVDDKLLVRVAGNSFFRQGFVEEIATGYKKGREDYAIIRPSVTWKITDKLQNYTVFQAWMSKATALSNNVNQNLYDLADVPQGENAIINLQTGLNGYATYAEWLAARDRYLAHQIRVGPYKIPLFSVGCPATSQSPATKSISEVAQPCRRYNPEDQYLLSNELLYDFNDDFSLKYLFGYTWGSNYGEAFDLDASGLIILDGNPKNTGGKSQSTLTHELQFQGSVFDDRVKIVSGVFTNHSYNHPVITYGTFLVNLNDVPSINKSSQRNYSVYGQANIDMGDWVEGLSGMAGVRYSKDIAKFYSAAINAVTLQPTGVTAGGPGTPNGRGSWSVVSYTAGLQYQITPSTMVYFTNAKGYSAGGLQNAIGFEKYEPDSLNNFEVGTKSTFDIGGVTVRGGAAGYYGLYDNIKASVVRALRNQATGAENLTVVIDNAASAKIYGVDFEAQAAYGDFEFGGFFGYSGGKYDEYLTRHPATGIPIDGSDKPMALLVPYKWGFNGAYHLPLDRDALGDISVGFDYTRQSESWGGSGNPVQPTSPTNPNSGLICKLERTQANFYGPLVSAIGGVAYRDCNPPRENLDLNVTWEDVLATPGLMATFYVTNVTKEDRSNLNNATSSLGFNNNFPPTPRMMYLQLQYSF